MLWQHVVLRKSYAAENAPDCGCVSCVMLRETLRNARCKDKDFSNQLIRYCAVRQRGVKKIVTRLIRKRVKLKGK